MSTKILKFYVSNTDVVKHNSVYESIAFAAKRFGLAGATVYQAIMGCGTSSTLHSDKFWEINEKVPVIIEIVDEEEKIRKFLNEILPWIKVLPKGCLVTLQDVEIILQKQGTGKKSK